MMFNVPQFIDVEDKIAGPLTVKQLLWMIGMSAILLVIFFALDGAVMIIAAIPVVLLFVALAFYRPNGQPLIAYFGNAFLFLFRPKVMMWDRPVGGMLHKPIPKKNESPQPQPRSREVSAGDIRRLAEMIDRR